MPNTEYAKRRPAHDHLRNANRSPFLCLSFGELRLLDPAGSVTRSRHQRQDSVFDAAILFSYEPRPSSITVSAGQRRSLDPPTGPNSEASPPSSPANSSRSGAGLVPEQMGRFPNRDSAVKNGPFLGKLT